jgi:hypothetical protein
MIYVYGGESLDHPSTQAWGEHPGARKEELGQGVTLPTGHRVGNVTPEQERLASTGVMSSGLSHIATLPHRHRGHRWRSDCCPFGLFREERVVVVLALTGTSWLSFEILQMGLDILTFDH